MDSLRLLMNSEDFRQLCRNMDAALNLLGIKSPVCADGEEDGSYAALQIWLRHFVEENSITFEDLFPHKEDQ